MIPRIAKTGTSFKGAGLYYLHDKNADTTQRVEFTHTHNLATDNAELGMRLMAATAMDEKQLKIAAGYSTRGRRTTKPVYSYSLAWHPDQAPDRDHMIAMAEASLAKLGMSDHQAVFIAHNDTEHPHIHVIANRVHPKTGKAANNCGDRLDMSRWAEAYERQHDQILCEQRVINNALRDGRDPETGRETGPKQFVVDTQSENRNRHQASKATERKTLRQMHKDQQDALQRLQAADRTRLDRELAKELQKVRTAVRAEMRPVWREFYDLTRSQEREHRALTRTMREDLEQLQRSLREAPAGALTQEMKAHARQEMIRITGRRPALDALHTTQREDFAAEKALGAFDRKAIGAMHDQLTEQRTAETVQRHTQRMRDLINQQALAKAELKQRQKDEKARNARDADPRNEDSTSRSPSTRGQGRGSNTRRGRGRGPRSGRD